MSYRLIFLEDTLIDRANINDYLSQFYPGTSRRFFTQLRNAISRLKEYPRTGSFYEDNHDFRFLIVGDYLVFYTVDFDNKVIKICRILHGKRNISKLI